MRDGEHPVIDTPQGKVRGRSDRGVARFFGLPYSSPPTGARRLRSPTAGPEWPGIRDALAPAKAALQQLGGNQTWLYEPLPGTSEDCLYLNVWTPDSRGAAPVLVWFHGGATRNGHGAAAAFDGSSLARLGVVVVTVNYRLGALGGLAHRDLADPDTLLCANWGLQDKLAALRWVQRCIGAFGGDRSNVTAAGQSSGGMNVAMLAHAPGVAGLCHRLAMQSPPLFRPPVFVDLDAAAEYTELLAARLGVAVRELPSVDGAALFEAEGALLKAKDGIARMGRPRTAPVRDGVLIPAWPYDAIPSPLPLLIGFTSDEARFWYDLRDADGAVLSPLLAPADDPALRVEVQKLVDLYYDFPAAPVPETVIARYRRADPAASIDTVWNAIYTDLVFAAPILHYARRHAAAGGQTFVYEFAHALPAPGRGAPHASDVPFVFGTVDHPHLARKVGTGAPVRRLAAEMSAAWASFARQGEPAPGWVPFTPAREALMRFSTRDGSGMQPLARPALSDCWPAFGALRSH